MTLLFRNRVGLAGVCAVIMGVWVLCFAVASVIVSAYQSAYWPAFYAMAVGASLVASGTVLARTFR